jgi:hypothetical protein
MKGVEWLKDLKSFPYQASGCPAEHPEGLIIKHFVLLSSY